MAFVNHAKHKIGIVFYIVIGAKEDCFYVFFCQSVQYLRRVAVFIPFVKCETNGLVLRKQPLRAHFAVFVLQFFRIRRSGVVFDIAGAPDDRFSTVIHHIQFAAVCRVCLQRCVRYIGCVLRRCSRHGLFVRCVHLNRAGAEHRCDCHEKRDRSVNDSFFIHKKLLLQLFFAKGVLIEVEVFLILFRLFYAFLF